MFSKSKITTPIDADDKTAKQNSPVPATDGASSGNTSSPQTNSRPRTASVSSGPSLISSDLKIIGNMLTEGDLQIEGTIEGDIRANLVTIGESALIRGEVVADELIVNGHVIGRIRALKVRLSASSRVEGDILHKTIAIEAGAEFEGFVNRKDDPINDTVKQNPTTAKPVSSAVITDTKDTKPAAKPGTPDAKS